MRTGMRCASRTQLMVGTTSGRSSPPALIAAVKVDIKSDEVKHDIIESMLEIATGVCENIGLALSHWLQLTGHNS
jgi:gamma-glutamyl:cysteine ligase YbdK (ATP-grasp superfamily)